MNWTSLLVAASGAAAWALLPNDLSGRIVDHAGRPIGDCRIALLASGAETRSHPASGEFRLSALGARRNPGMERMSSATLAGSLLTFAVAGTRQNVGIGLYDSQGSRVAGVWSGEKDRGRYALDVLSGSGTGDPSSPLFLRVEIGEWTASFALPHVSSRPNASKPRVEAGQEPARSLAKYGMGRRDSLSVACPDYPEKRFDVPDSGSLGDLAVRRPNIILFLADDLGWMDLGYQGSQYYLTPHLDRLASQSVRFPNAYAHPLCSPTRAAILSGKEPARLRFTTPGGHLDPLPAPPTAPTSCAARLPICEPQSARHLGLEEFTLAEALKEKGYQTAFMGKWHLGKPERYWPEAQGFDVNIGLPEEPGPCSYFDPYCPESPRLPSRKSGEYIVDRLTDEALAYLDSHKQAPFFLCLWQFGVHSPYQAKPAITARYEGKVDPRGQQGYPVMASMIQSLDESMGRLQSKLDELGLDSNTILVFSSDNGGNMYDVVQPGATNPYPTSNHPLRMGKGNAYEGGVRVPLLIKWPGVTRPGSVDSSLVKETDFYPTFLEMAGITSPPKQALDGFSLAGRLLQGKNSPRETVFCHFPHSPPAPKAKAVTWMRQGRWKLLRFYGDGPDGSDRYELYDLDQDIGETRDLAAHHPDQVSRMQAGIRNFLADKQALVPVANPNYTGN